MDGAQGKFTLTQRLPLAMEMVMEGEVNLAAASKKKKKKEQFYSSLFHNNNTIIIYLK